MYAFARQGVQVNGQGSHQRLSLTGGHLGDLTLVQDHAADQLHVVMHHVPRNGLPGRIPRIAPKRTIAFDRHIGMGSGQLPVKGLGRYLQYGIFRKAARRFLDHGKSLGKDLVEDILGDLINFLFEFVGLVEQRFLPFEVVVFGLGLGFQGSDLGLLVGHGRMDTVLELLCLGAKLVVGERLEGLPVGQRLVHQGHDLFDVLGGFVAEEKLHYAFYYTHGSEKIIALSIGSFSRLLKAKIREKKADRKFFHLSFAYSLVEPENSLHSLRPVQCLVVRGIPPKNTS